MTILVLGATGKTGRHVAAALGTAARPVSRSTAIRFDWSDKSTWDTALAGATALYLVPPAKDLDTALVEEFLTRAVAAGVRRVVHLSAHGVGAARRREDVVRASGVDWTILRPRWFNQNFTEDFLLPMVLAGEVALPVGPGAHPFIDARDIADVAVAALTGDGHAGRVYELSGAEAISFPDAVAMVAEAVGREIRLVDVPGSAVAAALLADGFSPEYADDLGEALVAIRDGRDAEPATGVRDALGRAPRRFADYVKESAASGVWG
ncbi:NAD(P)H-binding protein [Saccharothrix obliqua]|uniref:NAD(P)H-binding protein n=1 Tax=Saccharothrix obliqua TaxID=2861747 RepID=UPI001C5CDBCD|nr:NAD(P)H-binding protein [Saccharothrix obliqua]MBW4717501.1 NAD(P)H-binding protein [Saccharothrix obliqua]